MTTVIQTKKTSVEVHDLVLDDFEGLLRLRRKTAVNVGETVLLRTFDGEQFVAEITGCRPHYYPWSHSGPVYNVDLRVERTRL